MKKILFFAFLILLQARDPIFRTYLKPIISYDTLFRSYSVKMTENGTFLDKQSQETIHGTKGEVYNFSQNKSYKSYGLAIGVQKGRKDNFYELGILHNEENTRGFVSGGYTFKNYSRRFVPYIGLCFGVGYKQSSEDLVPANFSYAGSLGLHYYSFKRVKLDLSLRYQKNYWRVISHDYGNENWEDSIFGINLSALIFVL